MLWLSIICLVLIIHATVADFDGIAIEDFPELVVFWEVFVYQGEESVTDIGVDVSAEWRVVPEDVFPLSVSPFCSRRPGSLRRV